MASCHGVVTPPALRRRYLEDEREASACPLPRARIEQVGACASPTCTRPGTKRTRIFPLPRTNRTRIEQVLTAVRRLKDLELPPEVPSPNRHETATPRDRDTAKRRAAAGRGRGPASTPTPACHQVCEALLQSSSPGGPLPRALLGRSGRRAHLVALYAPVCRCISSNNPMLRSQPSPERNMCNDV